MSTTTSPAPRPVVITEVTHYGSLYSERTVTIPALDADGMREVLADVALDYPNADALHLAACLAKTGKAEHAFTRWEVVTEDETPAPGPFTAMYAAPAEDETPDYVLVPESEDTDELTREEALALAVDENALEDAYIEMLGEIYGDTVNVCGMDMDPVRVLREVDPIAYQVGFSDYVDASYVEVDLRTLPTADAAA